MTSVTVVVLVVVLVVVGMVVRVVVRMRALAGAGVVRAGLGLERTAGRLDAAAPSGRSISASTWSGSRTRRSARTSSGTCRLPRW